MIFAFLNKAFFVAMLYLVYKAYRTADGISQLVGDLPYAFGSIIIFGIVVCVAFVVLLRFEFDICLRDDVS
jgi:hypothetical protein